MQSVIRVLQPEILDRLPADHPDAVESRRDLRLINRIMGNWRWFQRELETRIQPADRLLELGAGAGDLGRRLARRCPRITGTPYSGLDLTPRPRHWPESWQWHQCDLTRFRDGNAHTVLLANLVLHHFDPPTLAGIGETLTGKIRLILASEPARRPIHQWQLRALWPFGINRITRHDAHVSVAAGFVGDELGRFLGLDSREWTVSARTTPLGAYRFLAERRP